MANQQPEGQPVQVQLPPVTLTAMGAPDAKQNQGNLMSAKASAAFPIACGLLAHCMSRRGDRIMLDYTAQGVAVRFEIDGLWQPADPLDRPTGDAVLAVFKQIANLNVQDRRSKQEGVFGLDSSGNKYFCDFLSQGVPTGERVLMKIRPKKPKFKTLEELGMREKMRVRLKQLLDETTGMVVISAPEHGGVTTTWNVSLETADRLVRDFVSLEDTDRREDEIINVSPNYFNRAAGERPVDILPRLLLKQPDVFVMPDLIDATTIEQLCEQVNKNRHKVIARVIAKDCIEALMRVLSFKGPVQDVAKALTAILNVRLIRRLCDKCKQEFQPAPQLLQRLGIPVGRVHVLYQEFQPPPPEKRVDEKGRPIEIPVCQKCGGWQRPEGGYCGRMGLFELLEINDQMRKTMVEQPNPEALRRVAKETGYRSLQEEGIFQVAQGATSITELQRVLKQ